jgi:WD40 repeat protein
MHPPVRHAGPVVASAFAPDARRVLTGGTDGLVKLWDLASDGSLEPTRLQHFVTTGHEWSPNASRIFSGNHAGLGYVWNSATGQRIREILAHRPDYADPVDGRWSKDGRRLVTLSAGAFQIWDGITLVPVTDPIAVATNRSLLASITPDGGTVILAGELPEIRFYSAETGQLVSALPSGHDGQVLGFRFTATGRWAYSWGKDGLLLLRNPTNGVPVLPAMKHTAPVWEACSSHDESRLAARCQDGMVHLWEIPSGRALLPALRLDKTASSIQFSPDGQTLLTAGPDAAVCVWDIQSGQKRFVLDQGATATAAQRNGSLIATASARGARLRDAARGEPLSPWFAGGKARCMDSSVQPDRRHLLTVADWDSAALRVWNFRPDERT